MILYSAIQADVLSQLDAEGGQYYTDELDIVPALNRAQDFLLERIGIIIGAKKFSEESLKGLIQNRIFQPSDYSRINVDAGASPTWGIISVLINPIVAIPPTATTPYTPIPSPANLSVPNPAYVFISGGSTCKRLNSQEFLSNAGNPFEASYVPVENNPVNLTYGYLSHVDTQSNIVGGSPYEITIRPFVNHTIPVSITFLKYPTRVVYPALGAVDFSPVFQRVLVKATLNEISIKQGDHTTLFQVTDDEVERVMQAIS